MFDPDVLLPTLIDNIAASDPDRLFCAYAKSAAEADVLIEIKFKAFANAVNACAWWLQATLEESKGGFETVAYLGPPDVQHAVLTLAAAKVERKALLLSPRNSIAAQMRLFEATDCKTVILAQGFPLPEPFSAALAERGAKILQIKPQTFWLGHEHVPVFEFNASLSDNPGRPFVAFHTSGSTGFPKPITYTYSALKAYIAQGDPSIILPGCPPTQTEIFKNTCQYVPFPSFHMVGLMCMTAIGIYWSSPAILGPSLSIPTAEIAAKIIRNPLCKGATLPPNLLVDIVESEDARSALSTLKYVNWLGGPLPPHALQIIKPLVKIYSSFGATEFGNIPLNLGPQDDAGYWSFSQLAGATFKPYKGSKSDAAGEPLFELVLKRQPSVVEAQLIFLNEPELQQYETKDLFSVHPQKPHLWCYRGRTDDMINTAYGNLIDPTLQENIVRADPRVLSALLVGTDRRGTAWLIEPRVQVGSEEDKAALKEQLWDAIERANELVPEYARVPKERVLFTTPDKPMSRASKGTVQRNASIAAYKEELDQIYQQA
ncbi:acetyl-CoA synthetase-like protein [Periconia macrospinosa]|uniref:Acetyl-CoA synthetase-like protein n=1 Tax=Periconia macrospinosa TaxID=97972 RepID=A0A2V1D2U4_9PLEO|nr:acetyl-CoA synthetase-like protein [Periconia macrospinosa]